jgi:hypothetical protein
MTLTKRTIIDQIEVPRNGRIQIRFALVIEEDGTILASENLRTAVEPGDDLAAHMETVNAYLGENGLAPIDEDDLPRLEAVKDVVHTPAVIKEHQERVKAEEAAMAAMAEAAVQETPGARPSPSRKP